MDDLLKLADLFNKEVSKDMFGKISYAEEAKQLSLLAGKLHYRSAEQADDEKKKQLGHIAKMVLEASDMLKRV